VQQIGEDCRGKTGWKKNEPALRGRCHNLVEVEFSKQKIQKFSYLNHVTPSDSEQRVHPIYVPPFLPESPSPVGFISRTPPVCVPCSLSCLLPPCTLCPSLAVLSLK
jgi:hypothetical protein